MLMAGLLDASGHYRRGEVMVGGPEGVHHIGPPAARVPELMANLLAWVGNTAEHPPIASSVFHYEFEFIHPFEDGNGRMGRLWQTLILTRWRDLFAHLSVESKLGSLGGSRYARIDRTDPSACPATRPQCTMSFVPEWWATALSAGTARGGHLQDREQAGGEVIVSTERQVIRHTIYGKRGIKRAFEV